MSLRRTEWTSPRSADLVMSPNSPARRAMSGLPMALTAAWTVKRSSAVLNEKISFTSSMVNRRTKQPRLGAAISVPRSCSPEMASRIGLRLMPSARASSASLIRCPCARPPDTSCWMRSFATRPYRLLDAEIASSGASAALPRSGGPPGSPAAISLPFRHGAKAQPRWRRTRPPTRKRRPDASGNAANKAQRKDTFYTLWTVSS